MIRLLKRQVANYQLETSKVILPKKQEANNWRYMYSMYMQLPVSVEKKKKLPKINEDYFFLIILNVYCFKVN